VTTSDPEWVHDLRQMKNEIENWPNGIWTSETMLYWVIRAEAAEAALERACVGGHWHGCSHILWAEEKGS
jgi:hypothetical protein